MAKRETTTNAKPEPKPEKTELSRAQLQELVVGHAPSGWETEVKPEQLLRLINKGEHIEMIVLAADIRRSTFLMKEALDFPIFAQIIGGFIKAVGKSLGDHRGWFDKFTGDGFLAYWILDDRGLGDYVEELFMACQAFMDAFAGQVVDDLRRNSKNFPRGIGLSLGIDAGPAYPVRINDELTVVGPPVVGAVRMVNAAVNPYETFTNVYLGEVLYKMPDQLLKDADIRISREFVTTKEYPDGQEAYKLRFNLLEHHLRHHQES